MTDNVGKLSVGLAVGASVGVSVWDGENGGHSGHVGLGEFIPGASVGVEVGSSR